MGKIVAILTKFVVAIIYNSNEILLNRRKENERKTDERKTDYQKEFS